MVWTATGIDTAEDLTSARIHLELRRGPGWGRDVAMRVDALRRDQLFAQLDRASMTRQPVFMMSANLHWAALSAQSDEVAELAGWFHLSLLDSTPLRWLIEAQLGREVDKLAGSDLVPELCEWSAGTGRRLFFLGAAPGVADAAAERARRLWPGCQVVGTCAPTPAQIDDPAASRAICQEIDDARPDVLLVALGMPRQERWIVRHATDLEVPIRFGIGASLDFLAGVVPRAPVAFQDAGLEWAWRMAREPRRLWRRYLVEDLPYGAGIAVQVARLRRRGPQPAPVLDTPATPLPQREAA